MLRWLNSSAVDSLMTPLASSQHFESAPLKILEPWGRCRTHLRKSCWSNYATSIWECLIDLEILHQCKNVTSIWGYHFYLRMLCLSGNVTSIWECHIYMEMSCILLQFLHSSLHAACRPEFPFFLIGILLHINLSKGQSSHRLGGTALAQVYGQIGNESPDLDEPQLFVNGFQCIQRMVSG